MPEYELGKPIDVALYDPVKNSLRLLGRSVWRGSDGYKTG